MPRGPQQDYLRLCRLKMADRVGHNKQSFLLLLKLYIAVNLAVRMKDFLGRDSQASGVRESNTHPILSPDLNTSVSIGKAKR